MKEEKKMKKKLAMVLALVMMVSVFLCACSNTGNGGEDGKMYKIGISQYGEHSSLDNCREGFIAGLEKAGLVEGEDFEIIYQNAGFDDNVTLQIAQSLISQDADLLCGIATNSAVALYAAAEDTDVPVIFTAISDPVEAKLDSGNVTGTSDKLPVSAQLDLIRKLQPDAKKIGIIYTLSEPNSVSAIRDYEASAGEYGFEIVTVGVTAQSEVTQAVDTLINQGVDCLSNLTDNTVVGVLAGILEKTNEAGIPVYGSEIEQVKKGCVASAGIEYYELGIQTGEMAAKILKGEAKASDIPYETISEYDYYINSAAADLLGVAIPAEIRDAATECGAEG